MSERSVLRERLIEAAAVEVGRCERLSGTGERARGTAAAVLDALPPRLLLAFAAEGLSDEDWAAMVREAAATLGPLTRQSSHDRAEVSRHRCPAYYLTWRSTRVVQREPGEER